MSINMNITEYMNRDELEGLLVDLENARDEQFKKYMRVPIDSVEEYSVESLWNTLIRASNAIRHQINNLKDTN